MKTKFMTTLLIISLLSGCGLWDDDDKPQDNPAMTTSFDRLVADMIRNQTSDATSAIEVNELTITFSDEEGQFDELLNP